MRGEGWGCSEVREGARGGMGRVRGEGWGCSEVREGARGGMGR